MLKTPLWHIGTGGRGDIFSLLREYYCGLLYEYVSIWVREIYWRSMCAVTLLLARYCVVLIYTRQRFLKIPKLERRGNNNLNQTSKPRSCWETPSTYMCTTQRTGSRWTDGTNRAIDERGYHGKTCKHEYKTTTKATSNRYNIPCHDTHVWRVCL